MILLLLSCGNLCKEIALHVVHFTYFSRNTPKRTRTLVIIMSYVYVVLIILNELLKYIVLIYCLCKEHSVNEKIL